MEARRERERRKQGRGEQKKLITIDWAGKKFEGYRRQEQVAPAIPMSLAATSLPIPAQRLGAAKAILDSTYLEICALLASMVRARSQASKAFDRSASDRGLPLVVEAADG